MNGELNENHKQKITWAQCLVVLCAAPSNKGPKENTMTIIEEVVFDQNGFMCDPLEWNADIGEAIAELLGLDGLGCARVKVIEFLREHYLASGAVPPALEVCHSIDLQEDCVRNLFGSYENAWKVAGLPDPGTPLRELMEDAD
jgi:sulfur relay (sulfurtransferase) DsrC/TusE family protein